MFDVKTYDKDGRETETIRNLTWVQMTTIQSVLSRAGIKFITRQISD